MRFERDAGDGFERLFPETFSFHRERHDPTELSLQLDDLLRKPRLISPSAHQRDATELMGRLLAQAPRYIERVCTRLETRADLDPAVRLRLHQDVALLCQLMLRFIDSHELPDMRSVRVASFLLRKQIYRSLRVLLAERVRPEYLLRCVAGEVSPSIRATTRASRASSTPWRRAIRRRSIGSWCAWRSAPSTSGSRASASTRRTRPSRRRTRPSRIARPRCSARSSTRARRASSGAATWCPSCGATRTDCQRLLKKLEAWFLRQYDIHHSSAIIHHADTLARAGRETTAGCSRGTRPGSYAFASRR